MDIELQRTDRVGDVLYGVTLAVGIVVHGIDAPLVPGAVMMGKLDAVQERIPEHHVGMGHVYLGAEDLLPFRILAFLHLTEELEVLFRAAVPPGAGGTGLLHGAAILPDLVLGLVVHIRKTPLDKVFGPLIELVEIITGIQFLVPLEAQPLDVFLDGIHIFRVFLGGIGIVVAEVGFAAVFLCEAEIEADALGMSQVQIAVGFRGKTGHDGVHFSLCQVPFNDFFQKVKFTIFHIYFL